MSRHSGSGSYDHRINEIYPGEFRLSWTVDRYVQNSRLRFPTGYTRDTDEAGARRFSKKWNTPMPNPTNR